VRLPTWLRSVLTRQWRGGIRATLLGGTNSTVLAARDGEGGLAGTVMVGHDGHRGWAYYLAVRPDLRRAGLGRQLMLASEAWLRDRGVPKINLMVRTTKTAVVVFYEGLGYEDGEVVVLGKFLSG
jgi:ribosomal protein S18 acetylase RimI-like enzyme